MPKATKSVKKETKSPVKSDLVSSELLKKLVHNDEIVRTDALKQVRSLIASKRTIDLDDFLKLWKGLWYTMWHSDTPLIQQALARDLAELVKNVDLKNEQTYTKAFWTIMLREWEFLDRYRINKFYMLIRFVLNTSFTTMAERKWRTSEIETFNKVLLDGALHYTNSKYPHNLRLHLIDIYVDELEKAMETKKPGLEELKLIMQPVLSQAEKSDFEHVIAKVKNDVLTDERLVEWGVLEGETEDQDKEDDEAEESEFDGFD